MRLLVAFVVALLLVKLGLVLVATLRNRGDPKSEPEDFDVSGWG